MAPRTPPPASMPARLPPRDELWLLAWALAAGIALRWWNLGLLAIEHYDEGVYASNLLFGAESGFEFPGRQFNAPPLVPLLIEWTTVLCGMLGLGNAPWVPMLPGLVCGTALIPSAWWTARCWFSPTAGVAAAWLVALSEFQAFYSRTALTDPVVLLWMLWAVHWAWRAMGDGTFQSSLIAAVFTALAWWTKYTGWLPLAIAASGGLCHVLLLPRGERNWQRWLRVLASMIAVSFFLWIPVLRDCQAVGGYGAVAANHRGYVQGWPAWWSNWLRQNANVAWYTGIASVASWGVAAYAACSLLVRGSKERRWTLGWRGFAVVAAGLSLSLMGQPLTAQLFCGLCVVGLGIRVRWHGRLPVGEQRAGCLLAAWFAGLLLSTPLYQPYPRLSLPLWLAGTLGVAWWLHRCVTDGESSGAAGVRNRWPAVLAAPILLGIMAFGLVVSFHSPVFESRQRTRVAARALANDLSDPARTMIYVYGDPGLFYQLSQAGVAATPRGDFRISPVPQASETLLVLGPFVDRLNDFPSAWEAEESRFEPLGEVPLQLSSLVLLDNNSPAELRRDPSLRKHGIRAYRVR